jgi:hypothetical protein
MTDGADTKTSQINTEEFMEYFGYSKGQESRLDLICKGEKPQAKSGKLEALIITYTKK